MNRQSIKGLDPLLRADLDSEWYMGATNINGTVGNGRLTAAVSLWGELAVLRWPTVSHFDHLRYRTVHGFPLRNYDVREGEDAASPSYRRCGRPKPVAPNMGSFGGVFTEAGGRTSWLHGPDWEPEQRYEPEDSNILVTLTRNPVLGLTVTITDFVVPGLDVLVRRFQFESETAQEAAFIYYASLAPTLERARYYPFTWRFFERKTDFLALYDERSDLILHFRPAKCDAGIAGALASTLGEDPGNIPGFIDGLDRGYGSGAYIAWGGSIESSGHHVGVDSTARGSKPKDAYVEAENGILSGSVAAPRPATGALSFPLRLEARRYREVVVYLAAASGAADAMELVQRARVEGFADLHDSTEAHWSRYSSGIKIPPADDAPSERVARRGILALALGTDAETGAMVASVSRQPQYCFDWPRDGAFFDYALDLAGLHGAVTRHADFYVRGQIKRDRWRKRRGDFEGHYYTDGVPGPLPFTEIDETGLLAWDLWRHARYVEQGERDVYLERVYPSIRMAADALMRTRPRRGGFPRRSREDDNLLARTRTLHGAASTLVGLRAAAEAGRQVGEDESRIDAWSTWAEELAREMVRCYDPDARRFTREGWRGATWIIWPARFLPVGDERLQNQAEYLLSRVEPSIEKRSDGFAYAAEQLLACAIAFRNRDERLERVRRALDVMVREVPTPGTDHFGEVTLTGDFEGTGERIFQNRTSIPHLWEGTLLYLALAAAYSPEWFDLADASFSW